MKRDLDAIRRILLDLEATESTSERWTLPLEGVPDELAAHNAMLLLDAALVEGNVTPRPGGRPPLVMLSRLTWAGHDFLDAAREPARWERVRELAAKAGGVTFDVLKAWLVAAIPNPFRGAHP